MKKQNVVVFTRLLMVSGMSVFTFAGEEKHQEWIHSMKRRLFSLSLLFLCMLMKTSVRAMPVINDFRNNYELEVEEEELYRQYLNEIAPRRGELSSGSMTINGITMPVYMNIVGEPGENGYPLYIALRGGGIDDKECAAEQTEVMKSFYLKAISSGIYVVPSGVCASWDEHYRPESFLFYDRIIEDAIAFHNADPNRVYLLGFSSGGDGVYSIAPRTPDRYAAVNMSAGYPHVLKLGNYFNLPICLQVGERDKAYDRNTMTAKFDRWLSEYERKYGGGYTHETFIHAEGDHNNWSDHEDDLQEIICQSDIGTWLLKHGGVRTEYQNTNAIAWMNQYQRDPIPKMLVWETSINAELRDSQAYYWLDRDGQLDPGVVVANYDPVENSISISTEEISFGTLKIYLSRKMLDVFRDVKVTVNGKTANVRPVVSKQIMKKTLADRGDPNYIFSCEIDVIFNGSPDNAEIAPVSFSENNYDEDSVKIFSQIQF